VAFAERITANKAPRILDVEGFSFLIGGVYGCDRSAKESKNIKRESGAVN
jgi:hypothetical protein